MRRQAFTLVELLVVIAIIALLLSILLPAVTRVKELGSRAVCAANQHSLGQIQFMIADEHDGKFYPADREIRRDPAKLRSAHKSNAVNDHLSWINSFYYERLHDSGVELDQFNCPNRKGREDVTNFKITNGSGAPLPDSVQPDDYDQIQKARLGYYLMGGRQMWQKPDGSKQLDPDRNDNFNYLRVKNDPLKKGGAWVVPNQMIQDGQTAVTADLSEQATWKPEDHSSYPHGPSGLIYIDDAKRMESTEAVGANTGFLDGSVRFQKLEDLRVYSVAANSSGQYKEAKKNVFGWFSGDADIAMPEVGPF